VINLLIAFTVVAVITVLAIHVGLLATVVAFAVSFTLTATPWTFDSTAWYFQQSAFVLVVLTGITAFAAYAARSTGLDTQR
jgi:ABC-type nickel/cobalt efflux system permease component RcnA